MTATGQFAVDTPILMYANAMYASVYAEFICLLQATGFPELYSILKPGEWEGKGKKGEVLPLTLKGGVFCHICQVPSPACSVWGQLKNCEGHWAGASMVEHNRMLWAMRTGAAIYSQLDIGEPRFHLMQTLFSSLWCGLTYRNAQASIKLGHVCSYALLTLPAILQVLSNW